MKPREPLALHHSWPLVESDRRFVDGIVHHDTHDLVVARSTGTDPAPAAIGAWSCDLADDALTWADGVYDIFGLPRGAVMTRAETLTLYRPDSGAAMERLRAHAIRHRRGFTLDAQIARPCGTPRWMRLIAAPVCADGHVVALHGIKQDVTHLYA